MTQQSTPPTSSSTVVPVPPDRAWKAFVEEYGRWIPEAFAIGEEDRADVVVEPRAEGGWYEVGDGGTRTSWGRVLAVDPPRSVTLAWHIGPDWSYDPDPDHASEVHVTFEPQGEGTRVELEHREFDRHGEGGPALREQMADEAGYGPTLAAFAAYCTENAG